MSGKPKFRTILLVLVLVLASGLSVTFLSHESGAEVPGCRTARQQQNPNENDCRPWQVKDQNGNCVDKPGTTHHPGHYDPKPGEQCWVECLCEDGQRPAADNCSPCSYQGMVCVPN
jgi:hypothetical protein